MLQFNQVDPTWFPMAPLPLLKSKISLPPLRRQAVQRGRLLDLLDQVTAEENKLGLVSAPAGYGKTALLATWCHRWQARQAIPAAWFALESQDDNPLRFWRYFTASLQQVLPQAGAMAVELLQNGGYFSFENLIAGLLADLEADPTEILLILDDFQVIHSLEVIEGLRFFLDHRPANLHVVISTRADPFLPLATLRARNQIVEIRSADLAFSPAEAADFFQQCMQLSIAGASVDHLTARTAGWVAGLQLAGLSLQQRPGSSLELEKTPYNNADLLHFFEDEIFTGLPLEQQHFLLKVAIFDQFDASLALAVSGNSRCADYLAQFEQGNFFLTVSAAGEPQFRFHPIFREMLAEMARRRLPATGLLEAQRAAAHCLETNGQYEAAFPHALASQDYDQAADLLERWGLPRIMDGEPWPVLEACRAFPAAFRDQHAAINLAYGWALLAAARFDQVETVLAIAENHIPANAALGDDQRGQVAAIRATLAFNAKDLRSASQQAQLALDLLSAENNAVRSVAMLDLADSLLMLGNLDQARRRYLETAAFAHQSANHYIEINCLAMPARIAFWRGQLHQALLESQAALQVARDLGLKNLPVLGLAESVLADVYLEWGHLPEAQAWNEKSLAHFELWGHPNHILQATFTQIEILRANDDRPGWLAGLAKARSLVDSYQLENSRARLLVLENLLLWQNGQAQAALQAFVQAGMLAYDENGACQLPGFDDPIAIMSYPLALILLHECGYLPAFENGLESWLAQAQQGQFAGQVIRLHLWQALLAFQDGEQEKALRAFELALALAEPEGYRNVFTREAGRLKALVDAWLAGGRHPARLQKYAAELFPLTTTMAGVPEQVVPHAGADLLSRREAEILRLVAAGQTNEEIARELYVSTNTVKTHLKRIFDKLGVNDRRQAVQEVARRGLIKR